MVKLRGWFASSFMFFSASPLIKMLFLFSFSFLALLVISGLTVALYRFQILKTKEKAFSLLAHSSSNEVGQQSDHAHEFDGFLLLISLALSLVFTLLPSTNMNDFILIVSFVGLLLIIGNYTPIFSLFIATDKLPFHLPLWVAGLAFICFLVSFFYFSEGSFFLYHFPFWADRLLGAALLFCLILMFQRFSSETYGLHISFGLVAFCFCIVFLIYQFSIIWLELSLVLCGILSAALYWVFCFKGYKLEKHISLSLGFFLGFFLLKLMNLGALWPSLIIFIIGCVYLAYPYFKMAIFKVHKWVFKN